MKRVFFLSLVILIQAIRLHGQSDTIVLTDYSKLLIQVNSKGELSPVTGNPNLQDAGFFITANDDGMLKFCNSEQTSIWVEGRLASIIDHCDFIPIDDLKQLASSDTFFVSISAANSLKNLTCQHVLFEDLRVIQEEVAFSRNTTDSANEFIIIALVLIVFFTGFMVARHPSRSSFLFQKTFTLKSSAYELVNSSFFSEASFLLFGIFSIIASFILVYLELRFDYGFISNDLSVMQIFFFWCKCALFLFLLFLAKYLFVTLVAALFGFKGLRDYQLFDFINFHSIVFCGIFLLTFVDFLMGKTGVIIESKFLWIFPSVLITFIIWFTSKFVSNSPRRKLMIISYLCATEIVPVVILLGYFFK
ncbi:MAG: DUF4271 domain-containing protein [Ekhidna sp.]|nr:DUF4271 domain-containing protein [Ekhidna sp.]